jgi:hypothetical protein
MFNSLKIQFLGSTTLLNASGQLLLVLLASGLGLGLLIPLSMLLLSEAAGVPLF